MKLSYACCEDHYCNFLLFVKLNYVKNSYHANLNVCYYICITRNQSVRENRLY